MTRPQCCRTSLQSSWASIDSDAANLQNQGVDARASSARVLRDCLNNKSQVQSSAEASDLETVSEFGFVGHDNVDSRTGTFGIHMWDVPA